MHLSNRGEILVGLRRFGDARDSFRRGLAIQERELGTEHADLGYALIGIGNSYMIEGHAAEAVPFLERALRVRERGERELSRVAEARFRAGPRAVGRAGRPLARHLAGHRRRETYAQLRIHSGEAEVRAWLHQHGA